jgi:urease gamma subunit
MPRRTDANQSAIVAALRQVGATVLLLHEVGHGAPDLCAGYRGVNVLLECKDGSKAPSAQALTRHERGFHLNWRGQVAVVRSVDEALRAIGAIE